MIGHVIHDTIAKGINGKFADLAYDITRHPGCLPTSIMSTTSEKNPYAQEMRAKRANWIKRQFGS